MLVDVMCDYCNTRCHCQREVQYIVVEESAFTRLLRLAFLALRLYFYYIFLRALYRNAGDL